jgi:hypothetical protein
VLRVPDATTAGRLMTTTGLPLLSPRLRAAAAAALGTGDA